MHATAHRRPWWDVAGRVHNISQVEGIEQGDLLARAQFALGQHDSLVAAQARARPDEVPAAFLDDLYVVTSPERAFEICDIVSGAVQPGASVLANLGKTVSSTRLEERRLPGSRSWTMKCGAG